MYRILNHKGDITNQVLPQNYVVLSKGRFVLPKGAIVGASSVNGVAVPSQIFVGDVLSPTPAIYVHETGALLFLADAEVEGVLVAGDAPSATTAPFCAISVLVPEAYEDRSSQDVFPPLMGQDVQANWHVMWRGNPLGGQAFQFADGSDPHFFTKGMIMPDQIRAFENMTEQYDFECAQVSVARFNSPLSLMEQPFSYCNCRCAFLSDLSFHMIPYFDAPPMSRPAYFGMSICPNQDQHRFPPLLAALSDVNGVYICRLTSPGVAQTSRTAAISMLQPALDQLETLSYDPHLREYLPLPSPSPYQAYSYFGYQLWYVKGVLLQAPQSVVPLVVSDPSLDHDMHGSNLWVLAEHYQLPIMATAIVAGRDRSVCLYPQSSASTRSGCLFLPISAPYTYLSQRAEDFAYPQIAKPWRMYINQAAPILVSVHARLIKEASDVVTLIVDIYACSALAMTPLKFRYGVRKYALYQEEYPPTSDMFTHIVPTSAGWHEGEAHHVETNFQSRRSTAWSVDIADSEGRLVAWVEFLTFKPGEDIITEVHRNLEWYLPSTDPGDHLVQ
jgi:hypothetical protein